MAEITEKRKRGRPKSVGGAKSNVERQRAFAAKQRAERAAEVAASTKPKRKPRSDSATAAVRAMVDAAKEYPQPPAHIPLSKSAIPFWNDIMRARSVSDWLETDLALAAYLAQCQADYVQESVLLRGEDRIIKDYLGKITMNPRATAVDVLSKRVIALMRQLHIGGAGGKARDFVGARDLERGSRALREELQDEEGLLA